MNDTILKLENIHFSYGEEALFQDLNFNLKLGNKIALTGTNGSGKTTLFHLIMGLIKPSSGNIFIAGKQVIKEKDFRKVRSKLGLLFQNSDDQLFCATVEEDIAFGPFNQGNSREEVREKVKNTLSILGLEGYEQKITYKLSGGEKRLVAIATILAMEPDALLLDEPETGLDEKYKERLISVLNSLDKTILIISHDKNFLARVTDKTISLKEGRLHY